MEQTCKMIIVLSTLTVTVLSLKTGPVAPDSDADLKPTLKTVPAKQRTRFCYHLESRDEVIPTSIPPDIRCLEIKHTQIRVIPRGAVTSLKLLQRLAITENIRLETIEAFAFADLPELVSITIKNCKHLKHIDRYAFRNLVKLNHLNIANTGLKVFPDFSKIQSEAYDFLLDIEENSQIHRVPANAFKGLCHRTIDVIRLTRNGIVGVDSNAFSGVNMYQVSFRGNKQLAHISPNAFSGSSELVFLDISHTALTSLPHSILKGLKTLVAESAQNLKKLPLPHLFTKLQQAQLTYSSHCCAFQSFQNMLRNRSNSSVQCSDPLVQEIQDLYADHCSNTTSIICSPVPDEFNPCEDIMSAVPLRVLIWIVSVLTLLGNTAVLLVLLGSRSKLTVPHFLMCHLAFADLCMGIYLVFIATVDIVTRGHYYNHAIDWQNGLSCSVAGFFSVFASELSVFTLTAITLERWHTITHALRLDRKLRMRHACIGMTAGWIFSTVAALLPLVGVSSYGKVSICLPMDVEFLVSQVYVVSLLLLNILAFIVVCACYLSIYYAIRNPSYAPAHGDTRVAKRMAVLIFTDFICMAPISFFAVSAALKLPLITVSDAKLLLVLFYPINSSCNPFLYAFFTRTFRRDFFQLTARFGLFKTRAQIYRAESSSCQQPTWTSPKSSHVMLYSLTNTLSHDGRQES
ncbi:follicle-stimulating hormone receptor [Neosynchiropus ocellatus]